MRTMLKLRCKNKKEAIDTLKKAIERIQNNVDDDDGIVLLKASKMSKTEKSFYCNSIRAD